MRISRLLLIAAAVGCSASFALAGPKKYDIGASDTEIRIGQTMPHSGPASVNGVIGRAYEAYFRMVNEQGGINGRKVTFFTEDDAFSPPKTVEATRRLVEQEGVLGLAGSLGTGPQLAVQKYLNGKSIPQIMMNTGASRWNNPQEFPWTTPGLPLYTTEARVDAKYVLRVRPNAKVAILYQNDDFGRDFMKAFKDGLAEGGGKAMVVAEMPYELTDPSLDAQIIKLAQSGADTFLNISLGKATAQAIKKIAEVGWKPLHLLVSVSASLPVLQAAGPDVAKDIVTAVYLKDMNSPQWQNDPAVKEFREFRVKYMPNVAADNSYAFAAWSQAVVLRKILERCGDELTHENLLKQALGIKGLAARAFLPGVTYTMTSTDYSPVRTLYTQKFNGSDWELLDFRATD
ncbi:MAG: ABC transporter substrate-binding protein [Beijerinckiaceae bacterium]